jgi:hypothetical protein
LAVRVWRTVFARDGFGEQVREVWLGARGVIVLGHLRVGPRVARACSGALFALLAAAPSIFPSTALAIVLGQSVGPDEPAAAWTVMVQGEAGRLCSGALIAPTLVLTAAHCVHGQARITIELAQPDGRNLNAPAVQFAIHPSFQPQQQPRFQPGADLAIVLLGQPVRDIDQTLEIEPNPTPVGQTLTIFGFGASQDRDVASARVLRSARQEHVGVYRHSSGATAQFAQDPISKAQEPGSGACGGDSGGPVIFGRPEKRSLVGIITWSAGATPETRCGGYTAFVPLSRHAEWVQQTARRLVDGGRRPDPFSQLELPPGAAPGSAPGAAPSLAPVPPQPPALRR